MKETCIKCLNTLGSKSRSKIYFLLTEKGPQTVSQLVYSSSVKQPTVSYHLGVLEKESLVSSEKKGKQVIYSINEICDPTSKKCMLQTN
jgi:DNA-binding transcriptional ArsR family regulator